MMVVAVVAAVALFEGIDAGAVQTNPVATEEAGGIDEPPFRLVATLSPQEWRALALASATPVAASPAADPTGGSGGEEEPAELDAAALVAALRQGGHVIYLRHAATDRGGVDPIDSLGDCAAQRNLSAQGRADAAAIGAAVRTLGIPVGRVLASPFCRTLDTARLAFGAAEPTDDLLGLLNARDDAERERRATALRRRLGTPPAAGTNTVLVGHASNIAEVAGVSLPEGGAAVFRPTAAATPPAG